jgi:hypothetical protein
MGTSSIMPHDTERGTYLALEGFGGRPVHLAPDRRRKCSSVQCLFKTAEEAQAALTGWPLGTPDIINARPKKPPEHLQKIADAMSDMTVAEGAKLSEMLKHKWGLRS